MIQRNGGEYNWMKQGTRWGGIEQRTQPELTTSWFAECVRRLTEQQTKRQQADDRGEAATSESASRPAAWSVPSAEHYVARANVSGGARRSTDDMDRVGRKKKKANQLQLNSCYGLRLRSSRTRMPNADDVCRVIYFMLVEGKKTAAALHAAHDTLRYNLGRTK